FLDRPFWSGAYGSISCPLGHQLYEVRWLRDRRYAQDFARYWFETPGAAPRSYSNWYGDAVWAAYLVQGDSTFVRRMLPHLVAQVAGWDRERWDPAHRMYRWAGMHDGMEYNIDSRQTAAPFDGADGYRPTLNSYLYADEMAVARASALLGDGAAARDFAARAAALKRRVEAELWDPRRSFFLHQFARDEKGGIRARTRVYESGPRAGDPHGREEIGFVPWQFDLPDSGYEGAWRFLMDTASFNSARGPVTAERHDPLYSVSPECCWWSGNEWPYATTQTLVALANLLDDYRQSVVTKADYVRLLETYTLDQRWRGRPYVAESANPDNGSWDGANSFYHSEHYFHSGYVNLVITGLAGLRPRADDTLEARPLAPDDWPYFALDGVAYHGHRVAIVWDRDGSRYHRGRGLMLFVDGRRAARAPGLTRLVAPLGPAAPLAPVDRAVNLAVNNDGTPYPRLTASFSAPTTPPFYANDGNYWYDATPANRWTTMGSGHASDWLELDFGVERPVEQLRLYLVDDGGGVVAPARYDVERWTGAGWAEVAGQVRTPAVPEGHRANTVAFPAIRTSKLRVVFTHRPGAATGLTEIEAWAHAQLPLPPATTPARDLAYNGTGRGFPRASASFTSRSDSVAEVNDGRIAFTRASRNRWTAYGSPHRSDWVQIDFGARRTVGAVDLYLWGDSGGVKAPRRYTVEYWDGGGWAGATVLAQTPARPETWALNTVVIAPVETEKIRVVFEHDLPAFTGVTELMVRDTLP
ncbi:MAG TPA: discoidin domain-containing protein, partial [Gemmatimonadales bacterium]|nr:discoidin domain-containing protein [Gemmatimonadales bacterium]